MAAKDFSAIDTSKQPAGTESKEVMQAISKGKRKKAPQTLPTIEERTEREMDVSKTRGRRGCYLPRINMAFSQENYDYIKVISKARHQTMTKFLDEVMTRDRLAHQELLAQARAQLAVEERMKAEQEKREQQDE